MWHFPLQLLQSKESFVYRVLFLKQILPCVTAKFMGIVQTEHLGRKNPTIWRAGPGRALSFTFFHLLRNKTWQPMGEAVCRGWFLGYWPSERKMRFQVRMRRKKSGQGVPHQKQEEGKKVGKKNAKTDTFPQRRKVPVEKNTKRPETSFSYFQYFKGGQPWHISNQNKSTIKLRLRFVSPSKRSRRSASSLLSLHLFTV